MARHEFRVSVRVSRPMARALLAAAMLAGLSSGLNPAEQVMTLSTLLPDPGGTFNTFKSSGKTLLGNEFGNVLLAAGQDCGFDPTTKSVKQNITSAGVPCAPVSGSRVIRRLEVRNQCPLGGCGSAGLYDKAFVEGDIEADGIIWAGHRWKTWPAELGDLEVSGCDINNCTVRRGNKITLKWKAGNLIDPSPEAEPPNNPYGGELWTYLGNDAGLRVPVRQPRAGGRCATPVATCKYPYPKTAPPKYLYPLMEDDVDNQITGETGVGVDNDGDNSDMKTGGTDEGVAYTFSGAAAWGPYLSVGTDSNVTMSCWYRFYTEKDVNSPDYGYSGWKGQCELTFKVAGAFNYYVEAAKPLKPPNIPAE